MKTLLKKESETRNNRETIFSLFLFSFWILCHVRQYLIENVFIPSRHFRVNLPHPRYEEGGGRNGYQGWIPDIVVPNSVIPLQIEDAVKCDGQADKQQGSTEEKPTAETKTVSGLTAPSKPAAVLNVFADSLKNVN